MSTQAEPIPLSYEPIGNVRARTAIIIRQYLLVMMSVYVYLLIRSRIGASAGGTGWLPTSADLTHSLSTAAILGVVLALFGFLPNRSRLWEVDDHGITIHRSRGKRDKIHWDRVRSLKRSWCSLRMSIKGDWISEFIVGVPRCEADAIVKRWKAETAELDADLPSHK